MTADDIEVITSGIVDTVKGALGQVIPPLKRQIADLEQKVATLEARPAVEYAGIWQDGKTYPAGSLCTRSGSLWLATCGSTSVTPGDGNACWKLIVKQGKA
jgi:hypothetical protein